MLASEMSRQGTMLFRYRSFIPVILISPMLLAWATADSTSQTSPLALPWDCICFLVSFAGLMLRVGTVGFVPAGTSGRNTAQQVANVLNTSGMNSTTRNPLYFGTFLMWLGW
jgi:protein-S-isoprenylcysteine O-methyltransferase Ste14